MENHRGNPLFPLASPPARRSRGRPDPPRASSPSSLPCIAVATGHGRAKPDWRRRRRGPCVLPCGGAPWACSPEPERGAAVGGRGGCARWRRHCAGSCCVADTVGGGACLGCDWIWPPDDEGCGALPWCVRGSGLVALGGGSVARRRGLQAAWAAVGVLFGAPGGGGWIFRSQACGGSARAMVVSAATRFFERCSLDGDGAVARPLGGGLAQRLAAAPSRPRFGAFGAPYGSRRAWLDHRLCWLRWIEMRLVQGVAETVARLL